ncbi:amidohydrolase family protein [Micromonospora sp. 067-2]|uniref:amidohydrolase family protein n=1 Tax=Micromonospora sp. 067-2 TaxID=2789270 RepID=UPI00397A6443
MNTTTVDVHAHALIPEAEGLMGGEPALAVAQASEARAAGTTSAEANRRQVTALYGALTNPAHRLAAMDTAGIDVQLVSPLPVQHEWADSALSVRYSRAVNNGIATHCSHAPERLHGLGAAPLHHPDLAADSLREAINLGLRGVQISSHAGPAELSDPALDDFWACAEELDAIVFIHPWGCSLGDRLNAGYLSNTIGNPIETTVALSRLILDGTLDRHPRLRLLAAHGGGYLPAGIARLDHAWHARADARTCRQPPSAYLRRLWFDSLVYAPAALRALIDAVGADRVAMGTDYPFDMGVSDPLERLTAADLSHDHAELLGGTTAHHLLNLHPNSHNHGDTHGIRT